MGKIINTADIIINYVDRKKEKLDIIVAVLLAMCPILQHYKGLLFNSAITVLVISVPYLFIRMIPSAKNINFSSIKLVIPLIVYQLFRIINHGTTITEFGQSMVFIVIVVALAMKCINLSALVKVARGIAILASICLILQYITFYIFGFHIQLVPTGLLISSAEQWILGAQTGLAGVTGVIRSFYRPSAFFLEPSHLYLYLFPHLLILLFEKGFNREAFIKSIIITIGLILSTSGMGVMFAVGAWVLFIVLRDEQTGDFSIKNIFRKRNLIVLGIFLVAFIISAMYVPFVRRTVMRIFSKGSGTNAISGRIKSAMSLFEGLSIKQWILGVADNTHAFSFNIPGFMGVLYRHGILGTLLSYEFYCKSLFKLRVSYVLVAAIVIVTSFFSAHTHSTVGMLYYIFILMNGFYIVHNEKETTAVDKVRCEV